MEDVEAHRARAARVRERFDAAMALDDEELVKRLDTSVDIAIHLMVNDEVVRVMGGARPPPPTPFRSSCLLMTLAVLSLFGGFFAFPLVMVNVEDTSKMRLALFIIAITVAGCFLVACLAPERDLGCCDEIPDVGLGARFDEAERNAREKFGVV